MSLPEYIAYKESGISWIGKVPAHWNSLRIKTLFELMKRPPRDEDGVVTAFRDGEVTLRSNRRTDGFTNSLQEIGYQGVRRGDLVIHAMDAFAGAIGVSDSDGKSTPVYSVCKPRQGLSDSMYYGRLLRHMALSGFIESLSKGIRERSTEFRWAEAGNVYLPVPPILEQTAIAAFLDRETAKIDALIAEQEKLIALLAEKRRATISHAVTRGIDPNVATKDSGVVWLGEVPKHWKVGKAGFYISVLPGYAFSSTGYSFDDSNVKLLRGINVGVGELKWDEVVYWSRSKADGLDAFELEAGDVVIGMDRPLISGGMRVALVKEQDLPCLLLQRVAKIRPGALVDGRFIMRLLSSRAFEAHFAPETTGVSVPHISGEQIANFVIPVPPLDEQKRICNFLDTEFAKLDALARESERAIALLVERRAALISAAVTGQIDVRGVGSQAILESREAIAA